MVAEGRLGGWMLGVLSANLCGFYHALAAARLLPAVAALLRCAFTSHRPGSEGWAGWVASFPPPLAAAPWSSLPNLVGAAWLRGDDAVLIGAGKHALEHLPGCCWWVMCPFLPAQRLSVLPGSGALFPGDEPGCCDPGWPRRCGKRGFAVPGGWGGYSRAGGCPASGGVGRWLFLCQGRPVSVTRCERVPGGTAMLRQEMPLQTGTKTTRRDGRCSLKEGEDASVSSSSVSSLSADLPFCFPALFSSSPLQGEFLLGKHH